MTRFLSARSQLAGAGGGSFVCLDRARRQVAKGKRLFSLSLSLPLPLSLSPFSFLPSPSSLLPTLTLFPSPVLDHPTLLDRSNPLANS